MGGSIDLLATAEAVRAGDGRRGVSSPVGISRKQFLKLGSMGLLGAAISGVTGFGGVNVAEAASRDVAIGAYAPSLPWSFQDIEDYAELVGKSPAVIHWFQDWGSDWASGFDSGYLEAAASRSAMPLITWEPWDFGGPRPAQPEYALKKILNGDHDEYVHSWARAAAEWGEPFFLRFAHEMNGDWTSWSPGVNGNTAQEFVSAWRKVHSIFQEEGAGNVVWVWAPVAHYRGAVPYKSVYPGDDYVNWFGLSGYNWGNTQSWSQWQSFYEIFNKSYDIMKGLAQKPILIAEVGCTEEGGDKAAWIRRAFFRAIPDHFPRIKAVVWFHADKETDWRVNSSPDALEAYKKVLGNRIYAESSL